MEQLSAHECREKSGRTLDGAHHSHFGDLYRFDIGEAVRDGKTGKRQHPPPHRFEGFSDGCPIFFRDIGGDKEIGGDKYMHEGHIGKRLHSKARKDDSVEQGAHRIEADGKENIVGIARLPEEFQWVEQVLVGFCFEHVYAENGGQDAGSLRQVYAFAEHCGRKKGGKHGSEAEKRHGDGYLKMPQASRRKEKRERSNDGNGIGGRDGLPRERSVVYEEEEGRDDRKIDKRKRGRESE